MGHPADLPPSFSLRMMLIPILTWPANKEARKTHNHDIIFYIVKRLSIKETPSLNRSENLLFLTSGN